MSGYELFEAANKARQAWMGQLTRRYGRHWFAMTAPEDRQGEPGSDLRKAHDALKAAEDAWNVWFEGARPITRAA